MQVRLDDGTFKRLPTTLSFTTEDPHAVTAQFRSNDPAVTWVFARELLRDGMRDCVGLGDIMIRPGHPSRGAKTVITLRSPEGEATIEAPRDRIAEFVDAIYRLVPDEVESVFMDIDAAIAELLDA
jgi:hypothetical protein